MSSAKDTNTEQLSETIEQFRASIRATERAVAGVAVVSFLCAMFCLSHAVQEGLVVDAAYLASVATSVFAASVAGAATFAPWRLLRKALPDKPGVDACIKMGSTMMSMIPFPTTNKDD